MNYNLKNRPKQHDNPDWPKELNCYDNMEEWFEGFEEELRENLALSIKLSAPQNNVVGYAVGYQTAIKEILGE